MIGVIMAAAETVTQNPSALQTWGPWGAVIIALGGPKGVSMVLSVLGKGGNGNGKFNKELCEQRHNELRAQRDADRADIIYIRGRVDEIVKHMLGDGTK